MSTKKAVLSAALHHRFASITSANTFELDVKINIPLNGITAIFGKSGSGKTSLLRCIAGLETHAKGDITFSNNIWLSKSKYTKPEERNIALVFQEGALFTHLNVRKNLAFSIKRARQNTSSVVTLESVCSLLNLNHLLESKTSQLSGGERQRVAIARALLSQPQLLLMDEPLASLDAQHKSEILPYLEKLDREFNIPILYVSHSLDEVIRLAKNIVVLENGKVAAHGPTHEILSKPEFIPLQGDLVSSMITATIEEKCEEWNMMTLSIKPTIHSNSNKKDESAVLQLADTSESIGSSLRLRILAKDVSIALDNNERSSILNRIPATIVSLINDQHSAMRIAQLDISGQLIFARITRKSEAHLNIKVGDKVWAQIKSVALIR